MTRDEIIQGLAKNYRLWKKLSASLDKPPLNKQYKNKKCKSARKLACKREEVMDDIADTYNEMEYLWMMIPEVRQSYDLQNGQAMEDYAAQLVKLKRRPRFLKTQLSLVVAAQPEEAVVSLAGGELQRA